jgi:hypothetical protein
MPTKDRVLKTRVIKVMLGASATGGLFTCYIKTHAAILEVYIITQRGACLTVTTMLTQATPAERSPVTPSMAAYEKRTSGIVDL